MKEYVVPARSGSEPSLDFIVQQIADAAAAPGAALEAADADLANEHFDRMFDGFRKLRSRGVEGRQSLLTLLDHPDPFVRCAAATHAMEFAQRAAEPVLQALMSLRGPARTQARWALDDWQAGKLYFSRLDSDEKRTRES
jgi:hypothetical protein